jgi:hypothetical protein
MFEMLAITRLNFLSARYSNVRGFFKQLNQEITKVSIFFAQEQKNLSVKATSVSLLADRAVQICGKAGGKRMAHPTAQNETVEECVTFHKELLMLESYAVLNYCGLSKITKKHDKATGFATRQKFMVNVVNKQPFAHYAALKVLLQRTERLFEQLVSFHRYPSTFPNFMFERNALIVACIATPFANRRELRSGETLEVECTDGAASDEATPKKRKLTEIEKMKTTQRRKEQEYSAALALTEIVTAGGISQGAQPKRGKSERTFGFSAPAQ